MPGPFLCRPAPPPARTSRIPGLLIGVVVLLVTGACGTTSNLIPPPADTTGPAASALTRGVVGVQWVLSEFGGDGDPSGASFSLFPDGRYTVDDGTAVSTGTYTLHPDGIAFRPETGPGTSTESADLTESTELTSDDPALWARSFMRDLQRPLTVQASMSLSVDGLNLIIGLGNTGARFRYGGTA